MHRYRTIENTINLQLGSEQKYICSFYDSNTKYFYKTVELEREMDRLANFNRARNGS